ncbi:hypothetical protein [Nitrosomonas halophila]|nr:hypothetical protein [Nitrosomonas halophila]
MNRIRQYIIDNPARWEMDRENPNAAQLDVAIKKNFDEWEA